MTATGPRGGPVIRAEGLSKAFRRGPETVHALVDVTMEVSAGELVTLVGPSGSGKSTLLSILAGWEERDAGELMWLGDPLDDPARLSWSDVAVVPQTLGLVDELSIHENVSLPARLDGRVDDRLARADAILHDLGLGAVAARLPDEVSLGEQQRASVARALALSPRLVVADEPSAHQDADWTRGVLDAFRNAASRGSAVFVATHHRAFVRYADRILGIRDGRVGEVDADEVVAEGDEL